MTPHIVLPDGCVSQIDRVHLILTSPISNDSDVFVTLTDATGKQKLEQKKVSSPAGIDEVYRELKVGMTPDPGEYCLSVLIRPKEPESGDIASRNTPIRILPEDVSAHRSDCEAVEDNYSGAVIEARLGNASNRMFQTDVVNGEMIYPSVELTTEWPRFVWTPIEGATYYRITIMHMDSGTRQQSIVATPIARGIHCAAGRYKWSIEGFDCDDRSVAFSPLESFETASLADFEDFHQRAVPAKKEWREGILARFSEEAAARHLSPVLYNKVAIATAAQSDDENALCFPQRLVFKLGPECNLICPYCSSGRRTEKVLMRIPDKIMRDLPLFLKHAEEIMLSGGEPLLFKDAATIIDSMKDFPHCQLSLHTNGILLTEKWLQRLLNVSVNSITISIDAATEQTYKTHRGGKFSKLLKNLDRLHEFRREHQLDWLVSTNMVVTAHNFHEMPAFAELANKYGVPKITLSAMENMENRYHEEMRTWDLGESKELAAQSMDAFREAGRVADRLGVAILDAFRPRILNCHPELAVTRDEFAMLDQASLAKLKERGLPVTSTISDQSSYEKASPALQSGDEAGLDIAEKSDEPKKQNFPVGKDDTDFFCTFPWVSLYLDLRRMTFCCWTTYRNFEYGPRHLGLLDMWMSETMQEARTLSIKGDKDKLCYSFCPYYAHGYRKSFSGHMPPELMEQMP